MGLAKDRLFGKPKKEEGELLPIDYAYGKLTGSDPTLIAHARAGHLCDPETKNQLPKYSYYEEEIVTHVERLLTLPQKSPSPFDAASLTEEQKKAVENALLHPFSLITGGPGTGKTYTASQIVKALSVKTLALAPTGKAASHLEEKIESDNVEAGTLHSFLRGDPLDAKLILVDECSMIDPIVFAKLLRAIRPESTLVLMGDVDQLPAVEGGSIFADLIDCNKIPTTHLTICMRSDRVEILSLARAIREGKKKELRNCDLGFASGDIEQIYQKLWAHTSPLFPTSWRENLDSFRILSTLRKGPLGVDALNQFFYEKLSPLSEEVPIMVKKNDPKTGLCNGDTGVLIKGEKALFPNGSSFLKEELPPYDYAYCLSVHKSQGSEYDHVLLLVPDGSDAFGREVLYTGVTRAKNVLEIEGNPEQITKAQEATSRKTSNLLQKI